VGGGGTAFWNFPRRPACEPWNNATRLVTRVIRDERDAEDAIDALDDAEAVRAWGGAAPGNLSRDDHPSGTGGTVRFRLSRHHARSAQPAKPPFGVIVVEYREPVPVQPAENIRRLGQQHKFSTNPGR